MQHIVVTGGAGFIGSRLVKALIKEQHHVTIVDNLSTGTKHNLREVLPSPLARFIKADITKDSDALTNAFDDARWVFHLAALSKGQESVKNPAAYFDVNVMGTARVIEIAQTHEVKRFIYAASASCYGDATTYPIKETAPIDLVHPYALTKYLSECMVLGYGRIHDLSVVSLRLFNVYATDVTGRDNDAVVGAFLRNNAQGRPMIIHGDGTQTRDFVHVDDVVRAFIRAAESDRKDEIVNVGTGFETSINDLAMMIGGKTIHTNERNNEIKRSVADIAKISQILGWKPTIAIKDVLKNIR